MSLPAMSETQIRSLGWEDVLEEDVTTHSGILAWRIPRTEEPGGLQSKDHEESDTTERLHFPLLCIFYSHPGNRFIQLTLEQFED